MVEDENGLPPEPEETGVEGTQESATSDDSGTELVASQTDVGIAEVPLTQTMERLYDLGIRGEAAMHLLGAHTQRLEGDIRSARDRNDELRTKLQECRDQRSDKATEVAVLSERLASVKQANTYRRVMLSLGGIVAGAGFPQLAAGFSGLAITASLLGAVLLVCGWILPDRQSGEGSP